MPTIDADGFTFTFPDSWQAGKYDDWAFYRNKFSKIKDGIKAVDLVAFDEVKTLWLIEVKDFHSPGDLQKRFLDKEKKLPLHKEVVQKVYDTIAGLFAAKYTAVGAEQIFAQKAATARKVRVVLHIEQPKHRSRLFSRTNFDSANILKQLRTKIRAIDPHPLVVSSATMHSLQWKVRRCSQEE